MSARGNELVELYDALAVVYRAVPSSAASEWQSALQSVVYGGELLADGAVCYGAQQKERNDGTREEYAQANGDGDRVTAFSALDVAEPRPQDKELLPSGAVVPVAPESGEVLPVHVSEDGVDEAIVLLAEFPAAPTADKPGTGATTVLDPERVRAARGAVATETGSSAEVSLLFVSDTHVGYENRVTTGSGDLKPWVDELSSTDMFERIRNIAIAQNVDAVVHTGDVLDHNVDMESLDAVQSELDWLSAFGIPVYCIVGTHDLMSEQARYGVSVDGIAWLKQQVQSGMITELSTRPEQVADTALSLYGVSAGNVGIDDVAGGYSLSWQPTDLAFTPSAQDLNILCLHDGFTPYRTASTDVNLDKMLAESPVSFDCVLIGDEHHPKNGDFDTGYTFEARNGTPVLYTGPAMRISDAYENHDAFVTEVNISSRGVTTARHSV